MEKNYKEIRRIIPEGKRDQIYSDKSSGNMSFGKKALLYGIGLAFGTALIWGVAEYSASKNEDHYKSQKLSHIEKKLSEDFSSNLGVSGGSGVSGSSFN